MINEQKTMNLRFYSTGGSLILQQQILIWDTTDPLKPWFVWMDVPLIMGEGV